MASQDANCLPKVDSSLIEQFFVALEAINFKVSEYYWFTSNLRLYNNKRGIF